MYLDISQSNKHGKDFVQYRRSHVEKLYQGCENDGSEVELVVQGCAGTEEESEEFGGDVWKGTKNGRDGVGHCGDD